MRYEPIDPMSREDVAAALGRAEPEELLRVVLAVALHAQDLAWASEVCLQLARHQHFNVRGNAILGLGHLARRFGRLDPVARDVIEEGAARQRWLRPWPSGIGSRGRTAILAVEDLSPDLTLSAP